MEVSVVVVKMMMKVEMATAVRMVWSVVVFIKIMLAKMVLMLVIERMTMNVAVMSVTVMVMM